mmetsp:Transcript_22055/g.74204  ORF Transcript_22055/g.74204 Transcript_22055/m.74204 type:complete len:301 (-) Transcript_22055:170-1072(-)
MADDGEHEREDASGGEDDDAQSDDDEGVDEDLERPKKRMFRQRAHCNPLASNPHIWHPRSPREVPFAEFYPRLTPRGDEDLRIRIVDIGCGFGSLVMAIAELEPTVPVLGMEIRRKPAQFVQKRVLAARRQSPATHENAWVVVANTMKCLPNYFVRHQLERLFICFPDPHFKKRNLRRRVVSAPLLAEYAFCLRPGGRLYTITDVSDVTDWMTKHLTEFPLFRRVPNEALRADPFVPLLVKTDEGLKVTRNNGNMFIAVFDRLDQPGGAEEVLPRAESAAAAADAGYTPLPGGERRGKTW